MDSQSMTKINYMFLPSMKHAALIKIASMLWNHSDVRDFISEISEKRAFDYGISMKTWLVVEKSVIKKVPELQLPRNLEKCLMSYINPLGFQILDWINFHSFQKRWVPVAKLPTEFFWTPQGSIDNKKVAEALLEDESLHVCVRLRLACRYCTEEYMKPLFMQLPEYLYKNLKNPIVHPTHFNKAIRRYWAYYTATKTEDEMLREPSNEIFCHIGFTQSVTDGNEAGTKYFLQRCIPEFIAGCLVSITASAFGSSYDPSNIYFSGYRYSNNLCYLLSVMNLDQQTEFLKDYAFYTLYYLLNWPWQDFFLITAKKLGKSLSPEDYYRLLQAISKKVFSGFKDFNYQNLFCEFWELSSSAYKRHAIMNEGLKSLLPVLFSVGDKENIKLILKAAMLIEKEFIFCPVGLLICQNLIKVDNWKLLKFFIQECISSEEEDQLIEKLQKVYFLLSSSVNKRKRKIQKFNKLYEILQDIEQENRKMCTDEI